MHLWQVAHSHFIWSLFQFKQNLLLCCTFKSHMDSIFLLQDVSSSKQLKLIFIKQKSIFASKVRKLPKNISDLTPVKLEAWKDQEKSKLCPVHRNRGEPGLLSLLLCQYLNSNPAELMVDWHHVVVSSVFNTQITLFCCSQSFKHFHHVVLTNTRGHETQKRKRRKQVACELEYFKADCKYSLRFSNFS